MKFYETINKYNNDIIDMYVDMDGVIAEYDIGNFDYKTIRPLKSNIKRINSFLEMDNVNVKILTVCKNNNIIIEKREWLWKYIPNLLDNNVVFLSKENDRYKNKSSKEIKSEYLLENKNVNNITMLIDDDNEIIKYIRENNKGVIVFQVSSWID